jgi:hypothetical protein
MRDEGYQTFHSRSTSVSTWRRITSSSEAMLFKAQVGTPAILAKVYAVASAEIINDHRHPWCSQSHKPMLADTMKVIWMMKSL